MCLLAGDWLDGAEHDGQGQPLELWGVSWSGGSKLAEA